MDCAARPGSDCDFLPSGPFIDRSGMVGKIEVLQCRHCNHGVSHPPIPDVAFLYGNRESQDYQPDSANRWSHAIKDFAFRIQARTLLRQIGQPGAAALDFGCGSGQFTRVLGELMPGTRLMASDFFDDPPSDLQGRPYQHNKLIAGQEGRYDLVLAMHVLEHNDDLEALLSQIVAPARKGGTVVVEVPNVECFWNKIFGRFWDAWYLPYHRHHFSRRSIVGFLERHGLIVGSVHDVTAPTMGRTAANLFGSRNNLFWLGLGILLHPLQVVGERLSGQPTAIRAICRKA